MIKRSFRFGLLVGVLAGLGMALFKAFGSRGERDAGPSPERAPARASTPWPRLEHDPTVPPRPTERVVADPGAPSVVASPASTPAEPLAEPEPTAEEPVAEAPATTPPPAPVERAVAKKAPRPRKAPAAKATPSTKATSTGEASPTKKAPATAAKAPATAAKAPTAKKAPAKKATVPTKKAVAAKRAAPPRAWVEPEGAICPTTHPVKGKLASKIFHVPGGLSYARTRPDRCYLDPGAAEADGLRPAKR